MIEAFINGQRYRFAGGISVLDACRAAEVAVPTLCHDARLKPIGSCRMCLVEIAGKSRPVPACDTQLTDGMSISTHTPALENERRMILRMLAREHPGEGVEKSVDKPFYRQALRYGLSERDFTGSDTPVLVDDSHPYRPTEEKVDAEFPFLLMTGRTLHQFNAGTMTMRTRNRKLRPTDFLEMSPADAKQLQLRKRDRVLVQSRYGSASLPILITRGVKPGELFATFHDAAVFLNRVTSPHRDRYVKSPEYKVTAVRVERVSQNNGG